MYVFLPLLGVTLLLIFADNTTLVGKILSQKILVFFGKISYSIYLIHFPIIILVKYNNFEITFFYKILIFLSVIFFSYLSWRFVEQPFRDEKIISNKNFLKIFISFFFIITVFGFTFHSTNGLEKYYIKRITEKEKTEYANIKKLLKREKKNIYSDIKYKCKKWVNEIDTKILEKFDECAKKYGKSIIVLGDSHALDVYNSLSKVLSNKFIFGVGKPGCRIFSTKNCDFDDFTKFIEEKKNYINTVFFVHQGSYYLLDNRFFKINKKNFDLTNDYLNNLSKNLNIVWFGFNIEPRIRPIYLIKNNNLERFENKKIYDLENFIKNQKNKKYIYFSRIDLMKYDYSKDYMIDGNFTYSDGDHWSNFGEIYFGKKIFLRDEFKNLLTND